MDYRKLITSLPIQRWVMHNSGLPLPWSPHLHFCGPDREEKFEKFNISETKILP